MNAERPRGMGSRLDKIRKENAEYEKETPFNYCDRWCERCGRTADCRIYRELDEEAQARMDAGKDPDDAEAVAESMGKSFARAHELMEKMAKEKGIDLSEPNPEADKEIEREKAARAKVKEHPLYELALAYAKQTGEFIESNIYEDDSGRDAEDYQALVYYHVQLAVKIHRFLQGRECLDEEDDYRLNDIVAQIDICRMGIAGSQQALQSIGVGDESVKGETDILLEMLDEIAGGVDEVEKGLE